jgi:hypothetical protein
MPSFPKRRGVIATLLFLAFAGGVVWLFGFRQTLLLPLTLFAGVAVFGHFYYRRRCSECGGGLRFRREFIGDTPRFRCLHDCSRCGITWDRQEIGDDSLT